MSTKPRPRSRAADRAGLPKQGRFVLCLRADRYKASLEARKVYLTLPDAAAAEHDQVRVIDESGEDYLYPAALFAPIDVTARVRRALMEPIRR